jgi:hypothetical protein
MRRGSWGWREVSGARPPIFVIPANAGTQRKGKVAQRQLDPRFREDDEVRGMADPSDIRAWQRLKRPMAQCMFIASPTGEFPHSFTAITAILAGWRSLRHGR